MGNLISLKTTLRRTIRSDVCKITFVVGCGDSVVLVSVEGESGNFWSVVGAVCEIDSFITFGAGCKEPLFV